MNLNKSILIDFPTTPVEFEAGNEVHGWVQNVEDRGRDHYAEIIFDESRSFKLYLNDIIQNTMYPEPREMKEFFDHYDYIALTVVDASIPRFNYDRITGMKRIGDVPWGILGDTFIEVIEIGERAGWCDKCHQEVIKQKQERRIKQELFDQLAQKLAMISAENRLNTNQFRNFFDEIKSIQGRIERSVDSLIRESELKRQKPRIKLLLARAANAQSRNLIPKVFHEFIKQAVEIVTRADSNYDEFEAFVLTFEAFTGFFSKYKEK